MGWVDPPNSTEGQISCVLTIIDVKSVRGLLSSVVCLLELICFNWQTNANCPCPRLPVYSSNDQACKPVRQLLMYCRLWFNHGHDPKNPLCLPFFSPSLFFGSHQTSNWSALTAMRQAGGWDVGKLRWPLSKLIIHMIAIAHTLTRLCSISQLPLWHVHSPDDWRTVEGSLLWSECGFCLIPNCRCSHEGMKDSGA